MNDDSYDGRWRDPKAELEDELVDRALEPWRKGLTLAEQEGMRLVLDMFVTTHPAMQSMIERRLREDGAPLTGTETEMEAVTVPDASGVVARGDAEDDSAAGRAGGER